MKVAEWTVWAGVAMSCLSALLNAFGYATLLRGERSWHSEPRCIRFIFQKKAHVSEEENPELKWYMK